MDCCGFIPEKVRSLLPQIFFRMKVNIIGAGVSGLVVGSYLQMCGFETEIFEQHAASGGLCTSWRRGEYTFDGCIQWLLGSNNSNAFYKLWSELIDMESVKFINHESRFHIELENNTDKYGSKVFILYTNLDRLEKYLLDIAPEDEKHIRSLISFCRKMQQYELPPVVDKVTKMLTWSDKISLAKYLPIGALLLKWKNVTNVSFARKLKNPFLKEAFMQLFDGDELSLLILTVPLASYDTDGAGYPLGGSYKFAQKFEEKYLATGGKINFNTTVSKILTENDTAKGLLLEDGSKAFSDITISASDWHYTVFDALDGRYTDASVISLKNQKKLGIYYSVFMVAMGLSRTFEDYPHYSRFPLKEKLISPDGTVYERMEVHIYNYDPTLAPEGKTVVSVSYYTQEGDYWIKLRDEDNGRYDTIKNEFAAQIIDALEEKLGNIKKYIEVTDVTTPATYHRYTGNFQGSVQGWLPGKKLAAGTPIKTTLPGLKNFYFTGHWSHPGGGLPIAIKSGRDITQIICKKYKVPFKVTR